ncbi:MAG: metallophosphoesterase family protein [Balneolales bacterium]|nr:metallophosphoesterase family protein [Balneolales bacterium]
MSFFRICFLLLFGVFVGCAQAQNLQGDAPFYDPVGLYLTWQEDPTSSMSIDWHVLEDELNRNTLQYRELGGSWSSEIEADAIDFPFSRRTIHRVNLTGLEPATIYEFRFGESSKVYNFRTMPADLSTPVRVAVGGDTMHRQRWMEKTARQAMKYDLDFVFILGDLAYADGLPPERQRHRDTQTPRVENQWYSFFEAYKNTLITEDYRVIPMVVTIGNHEVRGGYYFRDDRRPDDPPYSDTDEWKQIVAPYFFSLFATPGLPGYGLLDFGDYLSLILLDTDHVNPIENQNDWLRQVLLERSHIPHVFPGYHVPAYPSVRDYNDDVQARVRANWVPIFEEMNVEVVFEAHDHAYKRTHPIRDGRVAANGIVYIGDGAWGTVEREIGSRQSHEAWYIAEAAAKRHFILMTLHGTHRHFKMISSKGEVIDEYPQLQSPGR